jgi:hypothetical protein
MINERRHKAAEHGREQLQVLAGVERRQEQMRKALREVSVEVS